MTDHTIPATREDPHARRSDPRSSHVAVAAIAADSKLSDHIEHAARRLHPALFDDTDLLELVEEQTGRRQQRNVIARARGLMEYEGAFVRVGERNRGDRSTVHFRLPHPGEQIEPISHPITAPRFQQVAGWQLCIPHVELVASGSMHCDADFVDTPCEIIDFYIQA